MTSIIKVDQIQKADGSAHSFGGNVLEQISGWCDGRTVNGVTFPNVTTYQDFTTSWSDLTGSNITYTPPSGTTTVIYKLIFKWDSYSYSGISHWKVFLDSDEVTIARTTLCLNYSSNDQGKIYATIQVPFLIGGTDDVANAKLASWTGPKTIKLQGREYDGASYQARAHTNEWWEGTNASGSDALARPTITITALGDT